MRTDERLDGGLRTLAHLRRYRIERAAHIVGDIEHVAGERGEAAQFGLGNFARGPFAQIFHVGKRTQEPVFEIGGNCGRIGRSCGLRSGPWGFASGSVEAASAERAASSSARAVLFVISTCSHCLKTRISGLNG